MERARRHSAALLANAVSLGETLTSRSLAPRISRGLTLVAPQSPVLSPIKRPAPARHAPSVYLAGLAPSSRRAQRIALEYIALFATDGAADFWTFPWGELRFEHASAIRAHLADKYAPATARRMLCALKGALKAAWRLRQVETEDYSRAVDLSPIRGESLTKGRALSVGEVHALFSACAADPGIIGVRDAALLALSLGAGPRRAEATALFLADYDAETGALRIERGKGAQGRVTYLGPSARAVVDYWLEFRGSRPGPIILPLTRSGRILRRQMSEQNTFVIARKRARAAGLKPISPHDWRRTLATNLIDNGVDLLTVQQIMGHKSPETTAKYNRVAEVKKAKAAEGIFIPFARPSAVRHS